jgi:hypothetical protein
LKITNYEFLLNWKSILLILRNCSMDNNLLCCGLGVQPAMFLRMK